MGTAVRSDITEKRKPSVFKRFLAVLLVTVLLLAAAGYGGLLILLKGPSPYAGGLFAAKVSEHPAGKAVLSLFLTEEEIALYTQSAREQVPEQDGSGEKTFSVYPMPG